MTGRCAAPWRGGACDIGAFWACVHAFGGSIGVAALVMAYLAGHAFNVLSVPGGVGPVEGGMIAALVASANRPASRSSRCWATR